MSTITAAKPITSTGSTAAELNRASEAADRKIREAKFVASYSRRRACGRQFVSQAEVRRFARLEV